MKGFATTLLFVVLLASRAGAQDAGAQDAGAQDAGTRDTEAATEFDDVQSGMRGDAIDGGSRAPESVSTGGDESSAGGVRGARQDNGAGMEEVVDDVSEDEDVVDEDAGFKPAMVFRIFSDTSGRASDSAGPGLEFAIGGVDFFATAELAENVRALSESVLEILGDEGAIFDLERIYVEWAPIPELSFRLGRDHLLVGHYMSTFHHALFFQLATSRPRLLGFEDEGGLLPAHLIGLEALGTTEVGFAALSYAFSIGNGRGQYADDVLSTFDRNLFKSISLRLALETRFGLTVGTSAQVDLIPGGHTDPMGVVLVPEDIREYLLNGYVVYEEYPVEAIGEIYWIRHVGSESGTQTSLLGGYVQAGLTLAEVLTPYARVELVDRSAGDLFFNASAAPTRVIELRVGVRYALVEQVMLKLEYQHDFQDRLNVVTLQAAFAL